MAVKWVDKNAPAAEEPASVEDLRAAYGEVKDEQKALAEEIEAYREENAVKDIPNNMELARVNLDSKVEAARLALAQALKEEAGKEPLFGESQAAPPAKKKKGKEK